MQRLLAFLVACSNFFLALNTVGSAFVLPGSLLFRCCNSSTCHQWEDEHACEAQRQGYCDRFEFDQASAYGPNTVIQHFELVCDRRWLALLSQSLAMAGLALGALAFGRLSDRDGRRTALLCGAGVHAIGSLAAVAAPSVTVYAISRLVTSFGAASAPSLDVLLVESLVPGLRYVDSVCISLGFSLGAVCAAWLAPLLPSWRGLHALMLLHATLLFACSGLLQESARWLLSRGRIDEARTAVANTARFNGLPRGKAEILVQGLGDGACDEEPCAKKNAFPLRDALCSKSLRFYTAFMWYQAVALGMSYYTSSLTGTDIGGSPQLDFSLLYAAELGCNLLGCLCASRLPRRLSLTLLSVALAVAHGLLAFSDGQYELRLATSLLVKGLVSSQILLCFLHLHETYPTGLRAFGVSAFQCVCWAAASLEPFARIALGAAVKLPLAYAAAMAVCAVVGYFVLQETLTASLRDNVDDCQQEAAVEKQPVSASQEQKPNSKNVLRC